MNTTMDVNQVLAQMRAMTAEAQGVGQFQQATGQQTSFTDLLRDSIDSVNRTQQTARDMTTAFETGEGDAGLAEIMVAVQKSSLSFETMLQVRNKLLEAYKDIMNMPM